MRDTKYDILNILLEQKLDSSLIPLHIMKLHIIKLDSPQNVAWNQRVRQ